MASVRVGSAFGIPIKFGVSFLLVLPLIAYLIGTQVGQTATVLNALSGSSIDPAALTTGVLPWVLGAVAALGLFVGIVLHELGHSLAAMRYGLGIESITLWFLGGLAQFEEFPDDWEHELVISAAGPAVSLVLGGLFYAAFVALPASLPAVRFVVGYLALLNVVLAAFNLLPGFPMDGGRVLRALLSRNRSRVRATRIAATVGKGFAVLLGVLGVIAFNFFWIAIALFIYIGASGETRQVMIDAAFEGVTVADVMTPAAELDTVTAGTSLDDLLERMIRERHTGYPVVDDGELGGVVTLEDVRDVEPDRRGTVTVADVMSRELVTVSAETSASEAVTTLQQAGVGRLLVTDPDGELRGLVSRTDLVTVLQIVRESQSSAVAERAVAR